jgi:uncharacterized protein
MFICFAMFGLGFMIGFVGAGGAGLVIAVLTVFFGVPIHTALGTALGSMVFTTLSGVYSHFREGNVAIKNGMAVGIFGGVGAYLGVKIAAVVPAHQLTWLTAGMLILSACLLALQIFYFSKGFFTNKESREGTSCLCFWITACGLGLVCGVLSGTFGIGAAPFIQIGLLLFFSLTIQKVAGTTMLVILPIALLGGIGYLTEGFLDILLFVEVSAGLTIGTFVGAKFTKRVHPVVLKTAMVCVPFFAGLLLLLASYIR